MSGAALSESRMHRIIEHIQEKIIQYQSPSVSSLGDSSVKVKPSPGETLRDIRNFIDSELARPHSVLWRMMALYPEKEYKVRSVWSDIHRSIDDVPGGGLLEESVSLNVEIIRV